MKRIIEWIKNNPNRAMFLVPIVLVAGISISHVVSWYDIANPINWAIYLSIAIEVGAMTALVAATNKIKGGVWFMFGLVTFIQMIGNIFYSYKEIDANGELFKAWVELTLPVWESLGSDVGDIISLKRWLAFLEGGLLPIISLTSLHFFIKYKDNNENNIEVKEVEKIVEVPVEVIKEVEKIVEVPVEVIKEVEKIVEVPVEVIKEVEKPIEVIKEVEKIVEVPVKYYVNEIGEMYDENGHTVDTTTTTTTDDGIKRLSYVK
jgi:ribosomal protein L13E